MDAHETVEEVWKWREKAYSRLKNLPVEKCISEINKIGEKYIERLKLKSLKHAGAK